LKATERLQVPQDGQDDARPQEVAAFIKVAGKVLDLGQQPIRGPGTIDRSRLEAAAEAPIKGVASPFAKRPIISFCEAMLRRDIVAR
jgi:hypothetical protein